MGLQTVTIFREPMYSKVIPILVCLVGKMLSLLAVHLHGYKLGINPKP